MIPLLGRIRSLHPAQTPRWTSSFLRSLSTEMETSQRRGVLCVVVMCLRLPAHTSDTTNLSIDRHSSQFRSARPPPPSARVRTAPGHLCASVLMLPVPCCLSTSLARRSCNAPVSPSFTPPTVRARTVSRIGRASWIPRPPPPPFIPRTLSGTATALLHSTAAVLPFTFCLVLAAPKHTLCSFLA